ncbi:MAG: hypothetical protein DMF68_00495 [Acidobacteria bacterium]|nr:MAG: hypothetical protein DMF68_00495 [Acidobacteriota bacterium]
MSQNGGAYADLVGGGGSSQWTTSGNNIFYNVTDGNVGIGISNPTAKLHVVGDNGTAANPGSGGTAPQALNIVGGVGGSGTVNGGGGSFISIASGNGGNSSAPNNTGAQGGIAGQLSITGGTGGTANNLGNLGGQGGNVTVQAGPGGPSQSGTGGPGGQLILDAGAPGLSVNGNNGTPGGMEVGGSLTNVGIGTLSSYAAGAAKLQVQGTISLQALGGSGHALCINTSTFIIVDCKASSLKYKSQIRPYGIGLNVIERLRPVSFRWKETGELDFGLVAEEVNKVAPRLNTYTNKGEVDGVRYDRLAVVLINAIQQQQAQIRQQQQQIQQLKQMVCKNHPRAKTCQGQVR